MHKQVIPFRTVTISTLLRAATTLSVFAATALAAQNAPAVRTAPLRSGDRLFLSIPSDSLRGDTLDVARDGSVALPGIGRVDLSHIGAGEVPDTVRARYRRLLRVDDVAVFPLRRVSVLGEVRKPGVYFLNLSASLRDAVAVAQGVTDIGNPCCLTVVGDSGRRRIVDWQTLPASELALASGDALILDRESWLTRNIFAIISGTAVLVSTIVLLRR